MIGETMLHVDLSELPDMADVFGLSQEDIDTFLDQTVDAAAAQSERLDLIASLRGALQYAQESGFMDSVLRTAALLGAYACTHDHLRSIAHEADMLAGDAAGSDNHDHDHDKEHSKPCKTCKKKYTKCTCKK